MDLNLSNEELQFRGELRDWLRARTPESWEQRRDESIDAHFAFLRRWQRTLYEGGWAGISWPQAYGGRGASLMQQVIFWQEMALAGAPPMANVLGLGLVGPTHHRVRHRGAEGALPREDPERRGDLVPGLLGTERRIRPRRPADRRAARRRPLRRQRTEGVDQLRVGRRLVRARRAHRPRGAQAQGAHRAARGHEDPGVEVRPLRQMTGETEFNEVFFRDVRVPVENVVGNVNQGWDVAIGTLMHERGTFGAGLQITYRRNMDRLIALSREVRARRAAGRRGSRHAPEARAVLRRSRDHAREPDARVQPHQRDRRARAGRIDPEDLLERAEPAVAADRAGAARARTASSKAATRAPSIAARGRTAICARGATRSKPAPRKSSATSSATSSSACRGATEPVARLRGRQPASGSRPAKARHYIF